MLLRSVLIANRGEIAIRVARACAELAIRAVAVFSEDDAGSLHTRKADTAVPLRGTGPAAYLDIQAIVQAATEAGCEAVHPGYGFLSENETFARACAEADLIFVGPAPETLAAFGDKTEARRLARECNIPVPAGSEGPIGLEAARAFLAALGPDGAVMVKAVAGGGGRGMRAASTDAALVEAFARCEAEASAAFGRGDLYVEELIPRARHIEVQVIGDGRDVTHLFERECSLQRQRQKLVEMAPSPTLPSGLRARILEAALRLSASVGYRGLGTIEFLAEETAGRFAFIEANARLQVEHTVTEAILGLDLVAAQLRIAGGASLAELGFRQADIPAPRGHAIQVRVNMETMGADGTARPASGTLTAYEPPSGPGIRVDGYGYVGFAAPARFDSLLAKVIVHAAGDYDGTLARARRALAEFRVEGVATNLGFLAALLRRPEVAANAIDTGFVDAHAAALAAAAAAAAPDRFFAGIGATSAPTAAPILTGPPGTEAVPAPMQALVVSIDAADGDVVRPGQQVAVLEAMKMQHVVTAPSGGIVRLVAARSGAVLAEGAPVLFIEPRETGMDEAATEAAVDPDHIRPDLAEAFARHALTLDVNRPDAVARRRRIGARTARENVEDLLDSGSFVEYGALALAAQRTRRSLAELERMSPADGLIAGLGTINAPRFGEERAAAIVVAYDYTVLAGTQGTMNHKKQDRVFRLAEDLRRPLVLFAEGGGGRPGDTDKAHLAAASLDIMTFRHFARLSGLMPLIGIVHGRCFAGNAALLGCCDVIIATENATIGMGGPAMIEGGGLGVYSPEEVGPTSVQVPNGVIDVLVSDEAEAVAVAKQYLSYFQGTTAGWSCPDAARAAPGGAGESAAGVRHPLGDRDLGRHGLGAGAAAAFRARHGDGADPHRGPPDGADRQQPDAPGRRHRRGGGGQGGALHAALRRARAGDPVDLRHARLHGGTRGREVGAGAPGLPHVRQRREPARAGVPGGHPQGLRAGRAGDGRR